MTKHTRSSKDQSDAAAPRVSRGVVLKAIGITSLFLAVAVFLVLTLDTKQSSPFPDFEAVCVANTGDYHGFVVTGGQLAKHLRTRTTVRCPECGSESIARAAPCVSCGKLMPTGAHDLPPDNCPYCGVAQPSPTISDHDKIHSPGAHGEERAIVPLMEDPEPE